MRVATRGLNSNSAADPDEQSAPLTSRIGVDGGLIALMAVFSASSTRPWIKLTPAVHQDGRCAQDLPEYSPEYSDLPFRNVMKRPWCKHLAPISTSVSLSVVCDQYAFSPRQGERAHEIDEIVRDGMDLVFQLLANPPCQGRASRTTA